MLLWVLAENARARRFYERAGGRVAGERRDEIGGVAVQEVRHAWDDLRASPLADARA